MDNSKNDRYYLNRIITDIRFILKNTDGINKEALAKNEILLDSVMFRLIQISENADKLSAAVKEKHSTIPWKAVRGLRNRIVHEYGHVDLSIIYDTVVNDLPVLLGKLENEM